MAFPVTLNGNTYNAADFTGASYAQKFAAFAYDLFMDLVSYASVSAGSLVAASGSSISYGTGSKAFTVPAGKGFKPGMQVTAYRVGDAQISAMHGIVTAYASTTLTVTINSVNAPDTTASTNWIIAAQPTVETRTGTWTIFDGGTGVTTNVAAWEALKLPKYDKRPEFMDDMEGHQTYHTPGTSTGVSWHQGVKKSVWLTKEAYVQQANYRELYAAGVPKLGSHPGILEMSVKGIGSKAVIVANQMGINFFTTAVNARLEVGIYIPEFSALDDSEQFDLWIGMANNNTAFDLENIETQTEFPLPSDWIVAALNKNITGPSVDGTPLTVAGDTALLPWNKTAGWFTVVLQKTSASDLLVEVRRDGDPDSLVSAAQVVLTAGALTSVNLYTPIIYLSKKAGGTKEFKVYIDYWYLGLGASYGHGSGGPNLTR